MTHPVPPGAQRCPIPADTADVRLATRGGRRPYAAGVRRSLSRVTALGVMALALLLGVLLPAGPAAAQVLDLPAGPSASPSPSQKKGPSASASASSTPRASPTAAATSPSPSRTASVTASAAGRTRAPVGRASSAASPRRTTGRLSTARSTPFPSPTSSPSPAEREGLLSPVPAAGPQQAAAGGSGCGAPERAFLLALVTAAVLGLGGAAGLYLTREHS